MMAAGTHDTVKVLPAPKKPNLASHAWKWPGLLWLAPLLAGVFLVIAVTLTSNLTSRFTGGPQDVASTTVAIFSAVVTFLQGGALLKAVTDAVRSKDANPDLRLGRTTLIASIVLLVIVGVANAQLPWLARTLYYPAYGGDEASAATAGVPSVPATQAIDSYQHAVALDPTFQGAYERMGLAYEAIGELDKSVAAFEAAYRLAAVNGADYQPVAPIIGWTWVMMRRGDFSDALFPLDEGFHLLDTIDMRITSAQATEHEKQQLRSDNQATRYQLLANRAWANLGLQHFRAAQADAEQALSIYPTSRVPHCLMAYIAEAERDATPSIGDWTPDVIVAEWQQCLHNAEAFAHRVEPLWLATARERLRAAGMDE